MVLVMSDLRALLREAHALLIAWGYAKSLCERIDAALSEPAPEPVAWQDLGATSAQGFLSVRDQKMDTWDRPLYAAPAQASQSDARDADISKARDLLWRWRNSNAWLQTPADLLDEVDTFLAPPQGSQGAAIEREEGA